MVATLPLTAPVTSEISNPAPAGSPLAGPGGTGTGVPGAGLPQGHVPGGNLLPSRPPMSCRWVTARPRWRHMHLRRTAYPIAR